MSEVYRPVQESLEEAHRYFASALPIHDQWEAIYIAQTDFARLDSLAQETICRLLDGQKGSEEGRNWMRFLGAATHLGSMDVVPEITQSLARRIFIKGRPGTGKSTFLKKIRAAANEAGWDTEEYRCAFDPNSADMVVIRGLGLCLFDSTAPHEHFPERPGDEILDLYEAAVTPGTDEANAEALREIAAAYKAQIRLATGALHAAWESWSALEAAWPWEEKALQQEQERLETIEADTSLVGQLVPKNLSVQEPAGKDGYEKSSHRQHPFGRCIVEEIKKHHATDGPFRTCSQ